MRVLVTGATGFVGTDLVARLHAGAGVDVVAATRFCPDGCVLHGASSVIPMEAMSPCTNWMTSLHSVTAVVHLAALVHRMDDLSLESLAEYRRVNVAATINLAKQAAAAGVRRFVFVSSVKVNGEETLPGHPFTEADPPAPHDPYAISKMEAEQGLLALAAETGMEVVIIRPPLVYGPGVKANFLSMMRWLARGVPLPLGAVQNRRSLVALDNLVDLIITCLEHPAAANQIFLVSDGEDMSTTELLRRTATALGKTARLLPVSQAILASIFKMVHKGALSQRLCGSLQVDITKARNLLGWEPPVRVDAALMKTARHFLVHQWR